MKLFKSKADNKEIRENKSMTDEAAERLGIFVFSLGAFVSFAYIAFAVFYTIKKGFSGITLAGLIALIFGIRMTVYLVKYCKYCKDERRKRREAAESSSTGPDGEGCGPGA